MLLQDYEVIDLFRVRVCSSVLWFSETFRRGEANSILARRLQHACLSLSDGLEQPADEVEMDDGNEFLITRDAGRGERSKLYLRIYAL